MDYQHNSSDTLQESSSVVNSNNSQLLESFGYRVGKKIGIGSYSTVRV